MFKLFVSLAVLAAASAALYSNELYITVNHDGSYVQINAENGMKINILKNRYAGQGGLKNFDITLTGNDFYKTFHLENQIGGDIIFDLFARYEGAVDDVTYQKIVSQIEQYVQQGEIYPQVLYMLLSLHNQQYTQYLHQNFAVEGLSGQGHYYGNQGRYGLGYTGYPYGQNYYNKYGLGGLYGQGQTRYTPAFWNQFNYRTQVPHYSGAYTPSIWNQFSYRNQVPFYNQYQGYPTGVNQYVQNQYAHQVEREVEQEVEEQGENQMYGQGLYQYRPQGLYHQYNQGLFNQYGQQNLFNNYNTQFQGAHYGQFPFSYYNSYSNGNNFYNMWRGIGQTPLAVY